MSSLDPPIPLKDPCTIIIENILYVYSPQAFQSLEIKKNAKWRQLPKGVPVSGAVCVKGNDSGPGSGDALWVVGGKSQKGGYTGLQKFSFATKRWSTVTPVVKSSTQGRQNHAVAFIESTSQILVYAGSRDDPDTPSIETFAISTKLPYAVDSYTSRNTPVISPQLLRWNESTVLTIGGTKTNQEINMFTPDNVYGWQPFNTNLERPVKDISQQRAIIVTGADDTKVLQVFDMSISPNEVFQIVLQRPDGRLVRAGQMLEDFTRSRPSENQSSKTASSRSTPSATRTPERANSENDRPRGGSERGVPSEDGPDNNGPLRDSSSDDGPDGDSSRNDRSSKKRKRDLSLDSWPRYDDSSAPKYTRSNFAIASNDEDLVVITGGNEQHPIAIFNSQQNSWFEADRFFGARQIQSEVGPQQSSVPAPTSEPTSSSAPTPGAGPPGDSGDSNLGTILGATLGSVLGVILLLVWILLYLRYRRNRKANAVPKQTEDEKRRLSFADRGDPHMLDSAGNLEKPGASAHDSVAMIGTPRPGHQRGIGTSGSDSSTTRLVPKKSGLGQYSETVEMRNMPQRFNSGNRSIPLESDSSRSTSDNHLAPQQPKRTSGWSRYFSGNPNANPHSSAMMIGKPTGLRKSGQSEGSSGGASSYYGASSGSVHDCSTHGPTEIPPLKLGQQFNTGRVSRVVTGSPPTSPGQSHGRTESAEIFRANTQKSGVSTNDSRARTYSSGISSARTSSIEDTVFSRTPHEDSSNWTPVTRNDWTTPRFRDTTASSVYSQTPHTSDSYPKGLRPIIEQSSQDNLSRQPPPPARVSDPDTWPRPPGASVVNQGKPPPIPLHQVDTGANQDTGAVHGTKAGQEVRAVQDARSAPDTRAVQGSRFVHDTGAGQQEDEYHHDYDGTPSTPTAITAIPVPGSTAMPITVKKSSKPPPTGSDNLSWVNLGAAGSK
ncbi:MAG: hypothetical protein M1831_005753 [Alyxoria varia]|nr:MAG: hypothetical protein M1831_005753 [Alyxoria varia]